MTYNIPPPEKLPEPGYYYHFKHDPTGPLNNYAYYIYGVGYQIGEVAMKTCCAAALAILLSAGSAHADVLQTAFEAINGSLKFQGSGLVLYQVSCQHPLDPNDSREYVGSSTVVFLNKSDQAVLINTGLCNGGNGHGQHLAVVQNGEANIITNIGIQDMNFLADHMYGEGDSLFMYGSRWLQSDPHCCPSRKATLEYNIKTQEHKLTLVPKQ